VALWRSARPPHGFTELWCQPLGSLAELGRLRARVRDSVATDPADPEQTVDGLVLIVDELASNALRHGTAPVWATLSRSRHGWLVAVTDARVETPPAPARDRDPRNGGFGLYLVADLSSGHGWFRNGTQKTAWAVVPSSPLRSGEPSPGRR